MKSNKNKKKTNSSKLIKICILSLIILIIVLIILIHMKQKLKVEAQKNINNTTSNQDIIEKKQNNTVTSAEHQLSLLKEGTERDRIEYYCGQFFNYIENKNYAKAYEVLYPEFKQQYFPTIEEFTKYVQKTYPSILAINYDDFDRQGDIYITTVIVDDALATDKTKQFKQRIIVQESDYNKYVLSFQVI